MPKKTPILIRRMRNKREAEICAKAMAASEPWITLRLGYEAAMKAMTNKTREIYVATHGKIIVGYVMLDVRGPFRGYINLLCVMPDWRNRQIGEMLIKHAEKQIFAAHPNVFLCVSSFNRGAQRFYKRMGFKRIGTIQEYIVKGHSEYIMRKTRGPTNGYKSRQ